eukprot:COSAG02_NODE_16175_length_1107_cov_0.960317_1_plen_203_part_00
MAESDALALVFYPVIFFSSFGIGATHLGWLRRSKDEGEASSLSLFSNYCGVDVQYMGERRLLTLHCRLNLALGLALAASNVCVYRVVLIEHLRGTVVDNRGVAAVITTLLIVLAIATVIVSHVHLLGTGVLTPDRASTHAAINTLCVVIILAIVVAKLSMGITFYEEDCQQVDAALLCGYGTEWDTGSSTCVVWNVTDAVQG